MKKRFSKQQSAPMPDPQPKPSKEQIVKRELGSIEQSIISKLQNSELAIPRTKIPYLSEKEKQSAQDAAYEKILGEKRRMEERIKELEDTEKMLSVKSRVVDKAKVSQPLAKVEITAEDKQNLKSLKRRLKQFQKSLEKKTLQIEEEKLRLKREEEQRLAEERAAANEAKKAKIEQKLQLIKQKSSQRQAVKKMQDNALKKIEQKKKLYQLLDEDWKQKTNQEQQRKQEIVQLKLKQKRVNFAQLAEHEKKYNEIMSQKKRELMEKRLSSSRQSHNSTFSAEKSKFYTLVLREQQKAKQEEELKKERAKQIHKKRLQYAQFIREQFVPKPKPIPEDESPKQKPLEQTKIARLTKEQIRQLGNLNLIQGNKRAKKKQNLIIDLTTPTLEQDKNKNTSKSAASHYHDYLRDVRVKKEENKYYSGFYNSPRLEAEKIMKDEKIKKEDKIAKIKLLANRFDTSSADLVSKIQGKIQILQVIN